VTAEKIILGVVGEFNVHRSDSFFVIKYKYFISLDEFQFFLIVHSDLCG
jgi:hypothetical protein